MIFLSFTRWRMGFALILLLGIVCSDVSVCAEQLKSQFQSLVRSEGWNSGQMFLIRQINDGEIEAVHLLAAALIKKQHIRGNLNLAIEVLEKGVELGDPESSFILGKYFSDGNYVTPDYRKALSYFELARNFGHQKAESAISQLPNVELLPSARVPLVQQEVPRKNTPLIVPKLSATPPGFAVTQVKWKNDQVDFGLVNSVGSGFTVSQNGLVATNEHVIEKCKKIFVIYQGKPKRAKLLGSEKEADFAIISISVATPAFFYFKDSPPELGEQLISGGFPSPENFGFGIKITTGVVSEEVSRERAFFQHSTPTQPGSSGSPLLNESGVLVGISTAVSTVKWGEISAQNVNFAVPNTTAKMLLKKWNLPVQTHQSNFKFEPTVLAKHLKKAAVQILCY